MLLSVFTPGLVSVIVPVYNRERLVGKTIESILNQTYPWVEVIVINDGSSDNSLSVLQSYTNRNPGRIEVVNQANSGQVRARNNGLIKARGEYLAFLDSDDTWEREKLALQIPLFKGNVGLVYCGIHEVSTNGNIIRTVLCEEDMRGDIYRELLLKNRMTGGSVIVRRDVLEKVGLFDETLVAAENWDLWIRIAKEYQVDYVNKPLVKYLKHQGNMSKNAERMLKASTDILRKHLPPENCEEGLKETYKTAYANYFYNIGAGRFSSGNYKEARKYFKICWKYRILYKDSMIRYIRCCLGTRLNKRISQLKKYYRH